MKHRKFPFTPQENKVAAQIADGVAIKNIASEMKISIHTVRVYISNIRYKTSTHSIYEAVAVLARNGY